MLRLQSRLRCLEPSKTHIMTRKYHSPDPDSLFWLCRSGYLTLEYVVLVVDNYTLAEIPLETVVIDVEAWQNREIFVLSDGYPEADFQAFVARLHRDGQKWVRSDLSFLRCNDDAIVIYITYPRTDTSNFAKPSMASLCMTWAC